MEKGIGMIIEYAGVADRQVGHGTIHQVRAWWNVNDTTQGRIKRAAIEAVREGTRTADSVEYVSMDMSTYSHPQMDAMVYVRVVPQDVADRRAELKTRKYTACTGGDGTCTETPGELVRIKSDGTEHPLCYGCRTGLAAGSYQLVHWIKSDGRLQIN